MKIHFARHGQTDWNVLGRIQGSVDTDLNETGVLQANKLADGMIRDHISFSCIYSSPQRRARHTAQILGDKTNKEIHLTPGLEEINLGDWEGLTWNQVMEQYPEEYKEWHKNRRYAKAPNGEAYDEMLTRVLRVLRKIVSENTDDVVVITHGAVLMCLQCYVHGVTFDQMRTFKSENAKLITIEGDLLLK